MKANSTGSRLLTTGFWDGNPVISPDGKQIAFYRCRGTNVYPHMYVINATGGPVHRVLSSDATPHAWIGG
jgi:Tol biopolymer transport system component